MKQHEREFFISIIRSGKVFVNLHNLDLVIIPPTIDQLAQASLIYNKAYEKAYIDDVMTEEQMDAWMIEHGLWTISDADRLEGLKKDIERLKVEIYNARNDSATANAIRRYIRAGESQLAQQSHKKYQYYQNTCEGIATSEKFLWLIKHTTYLNNEPYDFSDIDLQSVVDEWQSSFLPDNKVRELSRNEPWKSLWTIYEKSQVKLFSNGECYDLTHNQKNLVLWSQIYDNIQESIECPSKDVIDDDDMLDGWFIIQSKKRDKEKAENEFANSTKSDKIKNASEVFVVGKNNKDKNRIESMNSFHGNMIKKQRENIIKNKGEVEQHEFLDERMNLGMKTNQQFIGRFKGGK